MSKTTFTAGFILFALTGVFSSSYAQPSKQEMARLIQKMDMLDSMDFQDAIVAANNCVKKRDFSCADRELKKARQLATNKERKQALALTEATFEGEKELVSIEKQQKELEEKIRQERIAEKKREREWQLEQARRQRLAEERAREQREKQQLISLGVGLLAGAATVYNGGDSELGAQVAEQTATGFYASMSGDREAQLKYQKQTAAMEQNLAQFKARQQAARQQQAERQREHQQMIKRHQENMRISQNRPTVKSVPSPAATRPAQPRLAQNNTASTQNQMQQRAAEKARQQRAQEKQAYEAQKMAEVQAARQRMASQQGRVSSSVARSNLSQKDSSAQSTSNAPLAAGSGSGYDATPDDRCWDGRTSQGASCLVVNTGWRTTISDNEVLLLKMKNICGRPLVVKWDLERRRDNKKNDIVLESGMTEIIGNSEKTRESLIGATGKWKIKTVGINKPVNSMVCSSRASRGQPAWIIHEGFVGK